MRIAGLSNAQSGAARRVAAFAAGLLLAFTSIGFGAMTPARVMAADIPDWHHDIATGHWYALVDSYDYAGAEAYAVSVGGHLVTINDQTEQDWLSATFPGMYFRIGFNDKAVEGTFVWTSGETPGYTNWLPGEPSNTGAVELGGEDVAEVEWHDGVAGWNDVPDDGPAQAMIEVGPGLAPYVVVPDDAATIAAALTLVGAGGTIHVKAGTYPGGFVIAKRVVLEGEGWDKTIIDGGGSAVAITVQTNGAMLSQFKVTATAPNVGIRYEHASNNTLDRVWTDGGKYGVWFYNGSNANQVLGSRATNATDWGFNGGDRQGGSGSSGNIYRGVEAWGNGGGITAYSGSDGMAIIDCNVHDNNGAGVTIGWLNGWSVTGTTITHNTNGLVFDSASYGSVTDNDISNNLQDGVRITGAGSDNNTVGGNRIQSNGTNGIDLSSAAMSNRFANNIISGNAVGARVSRNDTEPNRGNRFSHNTFMDNAVNAIAAEEQFGGNSWDDGYPSGGNSWDDATGADLFGGSGQNVPGADGIVDSPHAVPGAADVDHYPLVWHQPTPSFRFTADRGDGPGFGFVDGQGFSPYEEITVSLNGVQIGTPVADPYGNFWLDFPDDQDPPIRMVPGDTVAVGAGGATKTTVVTHLQITGVEGNVIRGIADTATLRLWVSGTDVQRTVAVVDGHWSVDVGTPDGPGETATTTLGPGSWISTEELDEDGDGTQADYAIRNPNFTVNVSAPGVSAAQFTPGSTLVLTINGTPVDADDSTFNENGDIWFELDGSLDVRPGDTVVVGDGTTDKSTVVTDLAINSIVGDHVSGTATSGTVRVSAEDADNVWREVPVAGGSWSADVSVPGATPGEANTTTLGPGARVGAAQIDEDGDSTSVETHVYDPRISVWLIEPQVAGEDFAPNSVVTVTHNGDRIDTDEPITTDRNGQFHIDSPVAFAVGDEVMVTDGQTTETMTIAPLVVDSIVGNIISGHATPSAPVSVGVYESDTGRDFQADATGSWSVNVSVPGDDDWEQQVVDLVPGSKGNAEERDAEREQDGRGMAGPGPDRSTSTWLDAWIWGTDFGQPDDRHDPPGRGRGSDVVRRSPSATTATEFDLEHLGPSRRRGICSPARRSR